MWFSEAVDINYDITGFPSFLPRICQASRIQHRKQGIGLIQIWPVRMSVHRNIASPVLCFVPEHLRAHRYPVMMSMRDKNAEFSQFHDLFPLRIREKIVVSPHDRTGACGIPHDLVFQSLRVTAVDQIVKRPRLF